MSGGALFASVVTGGAGQVALVVGGVIAARLLGVEDRGWLALLVLFPSLLTNVGTLGLPIALTHAIAARGANPRKALLSLTFPAALQATIVVLATFYLLAHAVEGAPARVQDQVLVSASMVPAMLTQVYGLAALQGCHRFRAFNLLRLLPALLNSFGLVVLLLAGSPSLAAVVFVFFTSYLCVALTTLLVATTNAPVSKFDAAIPTKEALRFGMKGWVASLGPIEHFRIEQIAVGLLVSPVALGLYVVAGSFANLPRFLAQSIGMVAFPDVARALTTSRKALLWRYMAAAAVVCGLAVGSLELLVPSLVPFFFGEPFTGAIPIARILLIAAFIFGLRRVLSDAVAGLGRPGEAAVAEIFAWITLAGTLPVSIHWGAEGVASSVLIAAALSFAVLLVLVLRHPSATTVRIKELEKDNPSPHLA